MDSVREKTIWKLKQALLKQKPKLSPTLWDKKNSFLSPRATTETSAKDPQLRFQAQDAATELFSRGIWACELFWKETPHMIKQQIVPIDRCWTFLGILRLSVYKTDNNVKRSKIKA